MIPTYNCAEYLRKTLKSVLVQDPGSEIMQIMVVDNCSTQDDPEAVVNELGQGRVEFYRHPQNIGSIRNFNKCLELARGRLVHILHGDDYVLEGFYDKIQCLFQKYPQIGAAFCRGMNVDESEQLLYLYDLELPESGILPDTWLEKIAVRCCVTTPAMVVRREVYENLGGYDLDLVGADDWEMWVRIASQYPIGYEANCLAAYRQHSKSLSESILNGKVLLLEHYQAIQAIQLHLPQSIKHKLFRQAKQNSVLYCLRFAKLSVHSRNWQQAIAIVQLALWMSPSHRTIFRVGQIFLIDSTIAIITSVIEFLHAKRLSVKVQNKF
jgi:glycosyltransferase involved in cell wall biosynthesis